jgi:hypothetical protein
MHRGSAEGRGGAVLRVGVLALMAVMVLVAAPRAGAASAFHPRIHHAMGVMPAYGTAAPVNPTGIPVAYHGGPVMRHVTIHTVFWAPAGYHFDGSPGPGIPGYQALIEQFVGDVAHDSGATSSNVFSVLGQYGDGAGNGSYSISYNPAADSVTDTDPYPPGTSQCPSPSGTATCVSDLQLQQELDKVIPANPAARGLSNVWFIFLPPDVDTCITLGSCATNAYAGYHSLFDTGHGLTIYAAIPDPLLEFTPPPGSDPQGNPEAESTIDTVAHEAVESITDPDGTGWMDPNGFETADKCEIGPQQSAPLGYASDGSPYNQVIDGHQYLIQDIWSNARGGCVAASTTAASTPGLHTIYLRQFSPRVSGTIGSDSAHGRFPVVVLLARAGSPVASAQTRTRANGTWGPVTLRGAHGQPHAVGDDRDQMEILYGASAASPNPDFIETGDGGNPFTESGYTGWFALDHGNAVITSGRHSAVLVGPCAQTGVLSLRIGGRLTGSPVDLCQNAADAAVVPASRIGPGTPVTLTSSDNRGEYLLAPNGALVSMTVPLGEPNSVPAVADSQLTSPVGGFPTCTAFLRIRTVRCTGLVPGARYRLVRRGHTLARARAQSAGAVTMTGLAVRGGDVLTLMNAAGRALTALHVAHLRVGIVGNQTVAASGTCQAGDYWGPPVAKTPISAAVGLGIAGHGTVCPDSGRARGLSTAVIAQTDDFSGGATETQVPLIESTAPIQDETLYGGFVASAQSGLPGPHGAVSAQGVPIRLTITRAGSRARVFGAGNVDTARGVSVPALTPGPYVATWVLHDAAGDTRTVTTRFVDEA